MGPAQGPVTVNPACTCSWRLVRNPMAAAWRSALRHVLLDVLSEDFVDQRLVPNAASTSFLSKLIEDHGIDSDGDQASWFVTHRRTTDATHGVELVS